VWLGYSEEIAKHPSRDLQNKAKNRNLSEQEKKGKHHPEMTENLFSLEKKKSKTFYLFFFFLRVPLHSLTNGSKERSKTFTLKINS
jgi:hypothetical protein